LKDLLHVTEKPITLMEIQYAICGHYQIGLSDLQSTRRERRIARPRQLAMYLSKMLTPKSLPDIGKAFGRDHTTVMHAVKTIEDLIIRDKQLALDVDLLTRRLRGEPA
jgi:chromosomal replication initiator protein